MKFCQLLEQNVALLLALYLDLGAEDGEMRDLVYFYGPDLPANNQQHTAHFAFVFFSFFISLHFDKITLLLSLPSFHLCPHRIIITCPNLKLHRAGFTQAN